MANYFKIKAKLTYTDQSTNIDGVITKGATHNITSFTQDDLDTLDAQGTPRTITPNMTIPCDWVGEIIDDGTGKFIYVVKVDDGVKLTGVNVLGVETNIREEWLTWDAGNVDAEESVLNNDNN